MGTNQSRIAVVVLTYNQESLISQCIESVLNQSTSAEIQIHVIDDASTDNTRESISFYVNKYPGKVFPFFYSKNQYQNGLPPEFPVIEAVDAEYIAFCDGDDFWIDSHKIEKQLDIFNSSDSLAIVHTDYFFGEQNGEEIRLNRRREKDVEKAKNVGNVYDLVHGNEIKKSTAMYRKSSIDFDFLKKCNGVRAQDWLVSVSAASKGGIVFLDEPTTVYRLSSHASFQSLTQEERLKVKNEVRKFCALNHPDKRIRKHFKRFLMKESLREKFGRSLIYRPFRPLVKKFRDRK